MSSYPAALARLVLAARPESMVKEGANWKCRCPAHADRKASLAIKIGQDGKLALYCHAGCATGDVLKAWGVNWSVLFPDDPQPPNGSAPITPPPSSPPPNGEPEAVYDYTDESGNLLFQVCRFAGKRFNQRRPGAGGRWAWNLHHTRRVLYRLPDLVSRPEETVFLVEGEKDADRLAGLGLLATTSPMGAGKWRSEYNELLRGRRVVLLPDNDDPGREHAETIAKALAGTVADLRVLALPDLPDKGDVSDWLDAEHTSAELVSLADSCLMSHPSQESQEPQPSRTSQPSREEIRENLLRGIGTLDTLFDREFEALRWHVYNLVTTGCTLLVGSPKLGKSFLALLMGLQIAAGEPFFGRSTTKCSVMYLALEDSDRRLHGRLKKLLGGERPPPGLYYSTSWLPAAKGGLELLDEWLASHPDVRLLIVDTLVAFKAEDGHRTGDAYSIDYAQVFGLSKLARAHDCATIIVHHDRKASADDWLHTVSGTQGYTGAADGILMLRRARNQADGVLLTSGRDIPEDKLALRLDEATMRWDLIEGDVAELEMSERRRQILTVLRRAGEPMSARRVAEAVEGGFEAVRKLLRRMAEDGFVKINDSGWQPVGGWDVSQGDVPGGVGDVPGGVGHPSSPLNSPGTPGTPGGGVPTAFQRQFWASEPPQEGGSGVPMSQVSQCPRCGCDGEPAGPSPTTFAPMLKCRGCGNTYLDRTQRNEDEETSA